MKKRILTAALMCLMFAGCQSANTADTAQTQETSATKVPSRPTAVYTLQYNTRRIHPIG